MAWTSPRTATPGSAFSAADFNTYIRDNLLETGPAIATTPGRIIASAGANSIEERTFTQAIVSTGEATASTTYTNLATPGPAVTATTGTRAVVFLNCRFVADAGRTALTSCAVSGDTTIAASDNVSLSMELTLPAIGFRFGGVFVFTTLTAGSNTFTMQYRCSSVSAFFANRAIQVMAF